MAEASPGSAFVYGSGAGLYGALYSVLRPAFPLLTRLVHVQVTSTEAVGRAMLAAVTGAAQPGVVTTSGINALADESPAPRGSSPT